jgi:predicted PurR-regulated permease PerM
MDADRPLVPEPVARAAAWSWRLLVVGAAAFVVVYALTRLKVVVLPVIAAAFLTAALMPLMRRLRRLGVPASLAALALILASIGILAGITALLIPRTVSQVTELQASLDTAIDDVDRWLASTFGLDLDALLSRLRDAFGSGGDTGARVIGGAIVVGEFVAGLLLTVVLTFFALRDGPWAVAGTIELLPPGHRQLVRQVGQRAWTIMGKYLQGVIIVGLVDAIAIAIGLTVIGVPLVMVLAILTFLGAFFPLVGATVAGGVAVLVALVSGGVTDALLTLGVVVGVQQLEGDLVAPVVFGRTLQVHPVVVLLSLGVGAVLGGVVGAALAVPIAAIGLAAIDEVRNDQDPAGS